MAGRPWTEEEIAALGTDTDERVAERIGRSYPAVFHKRIRLGIAKHPEGCARRDWTDEEIGLLGTMPDTVLAEQLGVAQRTVRLKRQKLGIPGTPHHLRDR